MNLLRSLVVVAVTATLSACGQSPSLPETDADLSGTLAEFLPGPAVLGAATRVLVEQPLPEPQDRTIVLVESGTRIYLVERRGGQLTPASRDDLAAGDQLQVWTTGVELRSYPAQVTATRIHIYR
jgi:hypothetical protein